MGIAVIESATATGTWDIALGTEGGQLVLLPPGALGVAGSTARIAPLTGTTFEQVREAPSDSTTNPADRRHRGGSGWRSGFLPMCARPICLMVDSTSPASGRAPSEESTMETKVDEIAPDIFRLSTLIEEVAPGGFSFNQFLVRDEQPFLFHTGMRQLYPLVSAAVSSIVPLEDLRWISFGHVEADECGALDPLLAVAPHARLAFGDAGWPGTPADLTERPARILVPGDRLDLGGRRLLYVPTPHAPHNQEAQVLFEETTATLLSGDLFSQLGRGPAVSGNDLVEAVLASEEEAPSAAPGPAVPRALRTLAELAPRTVATMHGTSFEGDGATALTDLAKGWEDRFGPETLASKLDGLRSRHG